MKYFSIIGLIVISGILNGCSQTREVLGFNRKVNDEFAVATTAPLTLPPNFNDDLPEPATGSPQEYTEYAATSKAKNIALSQLNSANEESSATTPGEKELLKNVNSTQRDPDIRRQLGSEVKRDENKNKSFVKELLAIKDKKSEGVLDPVSETERLKDSEKPE